MKTYSQIRDSIKKLEAAAEVARQKEMKSVVAKIGEAIRFYGLTARDLGLDVAASVKKAVRGTGKSAGKGANKPATAYKSKAKGPVKFRDAEGNGWSGRGPRPQWLRTQLAAGRQLSDFLIGAQPAPAAAPVSASAESTAAAVAAPAKKTRKPRAVKAAPVSAKATIKVAVKAPKALKLVEKKVATKRGTKKAAGKAQGSAAPENLAVAA